MPYTRFFQTDKENPRLMTESEVRAGVKAIKAVAELHSDLFEITSFTLTSIVVDTCSSDEGPAPFRFCPTRVWEGCYALPLDNWCEIGSEDGIDRYDEVVVEMIEALQAAVNNKLIVSDG